MNTPSKSLNRSKYARSVKKYDRRRRSVKKSNPRHKRYGGSQLSWSCRMFDIGCS